MTLSGREYLHSHFSEITSANIGIIFLSQCPHMASYFGTHSTLLQAAELNIQTGSSALPWAGQGEFKDSNHCPKLKSGTRQQAPESKNRKSSISDKKQQPKYVLCVTETTALSEPSKLDISHQGATGHRNINSPYLDRKDKKIRIRTHYSKLSLVESSAQARVWEPVRITVVDTWTATAALPQSLGLLISTLNLVLLLGKKLLQLKLGERFQEP